MVTIKPSQKDKWLYETLRIYEKIRREKKPYNIKVLGKTFKVLPNVFSPKYFSDSLYFAKEIPKIVDNKKFLEIGTGTGIIAIFCALKNAKVVATDLNPYSVKNVKLNAKKHNVRIDVRFGNLFKPIKKNEKFDFIFWNHPWNYSNKQIKDILLKAGFDYKYTSLYEFIREAKDFLNPEGKVLLGSGGFAKLKEIKQYARKEGYKVKLLKKESVPLEPKGKKKIDFIIYGLSTGNKK